MLGVTLAAGTGTRPCSGREGIEGSPGGRAESETATMRAMNASWLRPALAGGTVAVMSVIGGLLPSTGVMPSPEGFDPFNVVGVVEKSLWVGVAAVAASRPYTYRFAALVVLSSFTDLVWALGYLGNGPIYFLSDQFKSVDA